jgi:hypothetical protein
MRSSHEHGHGAATPITQTQTLKLALKPEIALPLQVFGQIKQKHEIDGRRR